MNGSWYTSHGSLGFGAFTKQNRLLPIRSCSDVKNPWRSKKDPEAVALDSPFDRLFDRLFDREA